MGCWKTHPRSPLKLPQGLKCVHYHEVRNSGGEVPIIPNSLSFPVHSLHFSFALLPQATHSTTFLWNGANHELKEKSVQPDLHENLLILAWLEETVWAKVDNYQSGLVPLDKNVTLPTCLKFTKERQKGRQTESLFFHHCSHDDMSGISKKHVHLQQYSNVAWRKTAQIKNETRRVFVSPIFCLLSIVLMIMMASVLCPILSGVSHQSADICAGRSL